MASAMLAPKPEHAVAHVHASKTTRWRLFGSMVKEARNEVRKRQSLNAQGGRFDQRFIERAPKTDAHTAKVAGP
jgi:hypothetical protein